MDEYGAGKVIRIPSLKRGKIEERIQDRIKLEKVLGVTVSSNAALASDENGTIAYPAGCTVVLFNTKTEQQHHIINVNRKTITCLAFSQCGRYIVTGECGHQPAIRVWDLYSDPSSTHPGLAPQPQQVAEFVGHKFGVNCVAFSPNGRYVVSVGTQHDMIVSVWDWKNNVKVASNKVSSKVKSVAFAENGSYFVTVGNRHVKFWYLDSGKSKYKEAVPLMGRSAILGEQRNNYFCDVACGRAQCGDSTYAITRSGLLCEFNNRRLLDKWVELRTTSANCITIGEKYIFVGCAEGIIRCFDPSTLRFITTLPRTHYLGVDVSLGTSITHMATPPSEAKYPDTVALTYNESNHKLTSIYNDHSVYVWDVLNIKRVGKSHSFLYHSACIWGVEMAPLNSPLPPGSFLTCSSDDTIRVWNLDKLTERGMYKQNVYSNELLKVVYVDNELNYLKDLDISVGNGGSAEKTPENSSSSYDGRNGVRCIRISPDGRNVASGDRSGNIRIHDSATMQELYKIEAHDAEVLCLEYGGVNADHNLNLMASASRDRLLHVFDVNRGYEFLQTLDDHSSSITAVRFLQNTQAKHMQMVSCGADKSLIFRSLSDTHSARPQFQRDHNASGKTTLYDMEVDAGQTHVLTACQDRNVRIYSVNTGKHTKSFKGSTGDDGTLIKVVLDRSGIYLATSCTDKSLSVYDYYSGECMATMCGHSELATGLRFTNDCKRLISASGDGCIFVWKVPHDMVVTMHARLSQQAMRQGKTLESDVLNESSAEMQMEDQSSYRFSIGQLPKWAKKQFSNEYGDGGGERPQPLKRVAAPKGRWAQRAENPLEAKNLYSFGEKQSRAEELRNGEFESTAHDGDIDSDNDYANPPLYYLKQAESPSESDFNITNMDADELRKSQRKKKGAGGGGGGGAAPQVLIQTYTTSQDSDDDDDEVSTPSGDNTDRNPMSLFSVSSESLDQLLSREKYLQSTFESMSGAENEQFQQGKTSISSKFLTKATDINMAAINAVKQTMNDPEALKKRQMLNKRIAETKKKLESVGYGRPLRYSQSIHDLSHIPEQDKLSPKSKQQGNNNNESNIDNTNPLLTSSLSPLSNLTNNIIMDCLCNNSSSSDINNSLSTSCSVPTNLQLCDCYMQDIARNTTQLSHLFNTATLHAATVDLLTNDKLQRSRKLKLDKTLTKYKLHKSLPVSPVNEERSFLDFVQQNCPGNPPPPRKSFSYFVDLNEASEKSTNEDFQQICSDIEKFSRDFNRKYEQIGVKLPEDDEEEGNFSSDSLEEYSFRSVGVNRKKARKSLPAPRRCVSSNELTSYFDEEFNFEEIPKSESFYLNQAINNSQDSILSEFDDDDYRTKSYCNSMESILSNESDCKSAPLEVLFQRKKPQVCLSQSLPKNLSDIYTTAAKTSKTIQTQTDFPSTAGEAVTVTKKTNASAEFQEKLLRFETMTKPKASTKKPVAFVVDSQRESTEMYIPSMASKNKQYKSRFCNVLNNKQTNSNEIFEQKCANSSNIVKYPKNTNKQTNKNQETSSLDRHLFTKSLLESEKICHKPPKAVRRHNSSKTRKKTYEYIRKEDFYKENNKKNNNSRAVTDENTFEVSYKEKNCENELEAQPSSNPNILSELYDSLDKSSFTTKIEQDSLDFNINLKDSQEKCFDSLDSVNLWSENCKKFDNLHVKKTSADAIQFALENIRILNEIQRKIKKINGLVDIFVTNMCGGGKVRALSSMYESMTSYYNDLTKLQATPIKFRRRNLSLPSFVERHFTDKQLNNAGATVKGKKPLGPAATASSEGNVDDENERQQHSSNLRRSCSLSDLRMQKPIVFNKKIKVSGKKQNTQVSRMSSSRYKKNNDTSLTRSKSSTVLNHSDSENDSIDKKMSWLMRPTISSHNKINNNSSSSGGSTSKALVQSRKRQSYSTSNLNTIGVENVSSTSDDEIEKVSKPVVPPRTRKGSGHIVHDLDSTYTIDENTSDFSSIDISHQICEDVIDKLTNTADRVVKLYNHLNCSEDKRTEKVGESDRNDKIKKKLELSILNTLKVLHDAIFQKLKQPNSGNTVDVNQTDTVKKLNDLLGKGLNGSNSVVNMMEQYSDILLDMIQQKMHNSNI